MSLNLESQSRPERDFISIPFEEYEAIMETMEILSDPKAAKRILEALNDIHSGKKLISEKEFAERFGLS